MATRNDARGEARAGWIKQLTPGAGPRYLQIADLIGQAIDSGELVAGDLIPAQRWLASKLNLDLTTVTRAYTEARNRGLIAAYSGRGSFVIGSAATQEHGEIDLAMNIPPQLAAGSMADLVRTGIQEVLARQPIETLSQYQDGLSNRSAIQAAQAWLRPALDGLSGQDLIACAGAQAAIAGILGAMARGGDTVLCEPLTYPGFLHAVRQLGLKVMAVDADEDGVMPDAIERCHAASGANLIYLNPTLQNPTARTMPESRRRDISSTLERLDMTLIEDDPYRYLVSDAPPPITTLSGGKGAYYLATMSKCIWPSLRTAFVMPPPGTDVSRLQQALRVSGTGSALLLALAEQWIRSGVASHIIQEIQRETRARQTLARSLLPEDAYAHPTGLHIWLPLPTHWNQHLFAHALEDHKVAVACSESFNASAKACDAIRISTGGASNQTLLRLALTKVAKLLKEDRRLGSRAIV
ncbi:aminotransferase-like domain-containing protein [Stutzerimonas nitrititolerans]|uniref:aminotransferase-like domain-containing protein n=1 Tax=Stutzerimonas nitrititolerans TaxID=2482751 RepID=UPI00289AC9C9|nr:PLP-dependent aminotransferase family protein [Stutzerimonas nitrititolerans]